MSLRGLRLCLLSLVALALLGPLDHALAGQLLVAEDLSLTHGVAAGDVTATSATIWARASGAAQLQVEVDTDSAFAQASPRVGGLATEASDFTATAQLDGLLPDTLYYYRATFVGSSQADVAAVSEARVGSFRTAPAKSDRQSLSFVVGGGLGGGGYCRAASSGYAIFERMASLEPDFFLAIGDQIYADTDCPAQGPDGRRNEPGGFSAVTDSSVPWSNLERVREVYFAHWRYNRADRSLRALLERTPIYVQWSDREVLDDFGANWGFWRLEQVNREGYPTAVQAGREAFMAYAPLGREAVARQRFYRSFRWGRDLELFMVDTRSYRSRNDLPDTAENDKTLLGSAQLAWLKEGLGGSDATWKVISSDVPISIQTGTRSEMHGNDGWASGTRTNFSSRTGFEREFSALLRFLDEENVRNVVFVTTDAGLAATIRYELDADGDGDPLVVHELLSGPLSAPPASTPLWMQLDPSFWPRALYGEHSLFSFLHIRIEPRSGGRTHLLVETRDADGDVRPGSQLDLTPDASAAARQPESGSSDR